MKKTLLRLALAGAICTALAACSPLRTLSALTPAGDSSATRDVAFAPGLQLDVYRPDKVTAVPAPVVVFFYGGNWTSGSRGEYAFVGKALAARGIVAVIADYRLYPRAKYPDFLDDSAQAVGWAVRHAAEQGGDPHRIFVMGHSAGAYNAAMLALDERWLARVKLAPSALRGFIGLAGPYDFLPVTSAEVRPVFDYPDTPADSQPVVHVTRHAPPSLLLAPINDRTVNPQRNTGGLAAKLREKGDQVEERYYPRVSHVTLLASLAGPGRWLAPTLDDVVAFIDAH
ncbi:acetyl esterase/lipase [Pseudoduganella lurida]|uniref:Acetyl esterase/lipase n=1 Tax=Pseudoduganella lurida TaxID=1036180 RepID=A0A562RML9_9BURK|nr:alpha/beta hydrolase [Pseudoduganella lurida]TWI70249.1 acetyl esterase/lipase [Pseudoduganella lurida]